MFLNNNKILRKFRTIYQICVSGPRAEILTRGAEHFNEKVDHFMGAWTSKSLLKF